MILFMYAEHLAIDWRLAEHSHLQSIGALCIEGSDHEKLTLELTTKCPIILS